MADADVVPTHAGTGPSQRAVLCYLLMLTAAVGGAATWFVGDVGQSDLWWHLAAGRAFFEQGSVPRTDPFSFSAQGQPWANHEWLWGVLAFWLYNCAPACLALANFALMAVTFGFLFEVARRASGSSLGAVLMTWLAAACGHFFFDIRPHLVGLAFTALFLLTRQARLAPWLWPPLLLLWCNLHASYVFGLGAIGLDVLHHSYGAWRAGSRPSRARWLALGLCLGAIGVNPWGYQLLGYIRSYAPGAGRSLYAEQINEWQPLGFDRSELSFFGPLGWFWSFRGRYWLAVGLAALGTRRAWARDPYLVLLGATSVIMALCAQRFVELSGMLLAPLGACALSLPSIASTQRLRARLAGSWELWSAGALAMVALGLWTHTRVRPDLFARWTQPDTAPHAALGYLRALDAPLRILNMETWGGYIALHAPRNRIFFDGRANTVYSESLYRDYLDLLFSRAPLTPLLAKHRPDAVLVPRIEFVSALLALPQPWRVVYEDQDAVLLLRPDSPLLARPLPNAARLLADEPQWLRNQAAIAYRAGQTTRALEILRRVLARDPLYVPAYSDLIAMLAHHGDLQFARQITEQAIAEVPNRERELRLQLGRAYQSRAEPRRASIEYRAAVVAGPFDPQLALRARIIQLESAARQH